MSEVAFWFRRDLRLDDNVGLSYACSKGLTVRFFFIFDPRILDPLPRDDHRVSFLWNQLSHLGRELQERGQLLQVWYGPPSEVWKTILSLYPKIQFVVCNHDYEPYARERDEAIRALCQQSGVTFYSFKDQVIFEKSEIVTQNQEVFRVFTPYKKKWLSRLTPESTKEARVTWSSLPPLKGQGAVTEKVRKRGSLSPIFLCSMEDIEEIGFKKSQKIPKEHFFHDEVLRYYGRRRDYPAEEKGTTRLGLYLRFGLVSVRQCVRQALRLKAYDWLSELIWREFFMMLLYHFPDTVNRPFRKEFNSFPYRYQESEWQRWCAGETGVPIVDAGMRELNQTGYMHNRVRMIVASYLTKHLLHDWRLGERYFSQKLFDFDLSANVGNWQWVAGCGVDAAPYFRIFNPSIQQKRFDPNCEYVKRWVPEAFSSSYPPPLVDHSFARQRALSAFQRLPKGYVK
ncbi:MAG: deoxyribodipyrimidine photo-lyase [Pseudobdellovibrionaceae bacterium]|nr:deoxyribodipyrimidine photo-lyase [Pseudobdellovibrionaceae bacterium]